MCGINVLFEDNETEVRRMNRAMSHRGIRDMVRVVDEGVTFGHVRLPIQDLSEDSDQPMIMPDGSQAMLVGEMLNFRTFEPGAKTDLPVLWSRFAKGRLSDAEGFWSMVLADRGIIYVVTDPLGKKPLYRRLDRPGISSEIGPLIDLGPVTPCELYYSMVKKWGYCMYDLTPFREIVMLPRNSWIEFDLWGNVKRTRQGLVNLLPDRGDLFDLVRRAVELRTVSDCSISLLLSGGLDSTIIFELLKRTGAPFTAYHVENGESDFLDHLDFPGQVTLRMLALPREEDLVNTVLTANETPVDLGSVVPQYLLGQVVAQDGTRVALSGDGADELFGGYGRSKKYDSQWSDVFCELPYYHLPRLDKLMMRHTIELRSPFLSIPVVRHALSLPYHQRTSKQELKQVFQGIVPDQILNREKKALKSRPFRNDQEEQIWRDLLIRSHRDLYWPEER